MTKVFEAAEKDEEGRALPDVVLEAIDRFEIVNAVRAVSRTATVGTKTPRPQFELASGILEKDTRAWQEELELPFDDCDRILVLPDMR